jgi:2,4-diketo-3-deoxy-L-fuconate hydrolase
MRLATVSVEGQVRPALVRDGRVHALDPSLTDMVAVIGRWMDDPASVVPSASAWPLDAVQLLPPVWPLRRNVFCVGWNYQAHFDEGAKDRSVPGIQEIPARPTLFSKATLSVAAPNADLPLHEECTARLDWEVELAVVIGRAGANIREADAAAHVFGYAVANDVSARDLQRAHGNQWLKGKSLDGSSPMGPWIVTRDEIADPQALALECRVNGVVKQRSNTRHQVFQIPRILAELSQGMTLLPGDVVFTGTPDGVGNARQPPEYLQDGDLLESEIEGIGVLRNRIRRGAVPRHAAA